MQTTLITLKFKLGTDSKAHTTPLDPWMWTNHHHSITWRILQRYFLSLSIYQEIKNSWHCSPGDRGESSGEIPLIAKSSIKSWVLLLNILLQEKFLEHRMCVWNSWLADWLAEAWTDEWMATHSIYCSLSWDRCLIFFNEAIIIELHSYFNRTGFLPLLITQNANNCTQSSPSLEGSPYLSI